MVAAVEVQSEDRLRYRVKARVTVGEEQPEVDNGNITPRRGSKPIL